MLMRPSPSGSWLWVSSCSSGSSQRWRKGKPAWVNVSHYLRGASDYLLFTGRSNVECKWR